MKKRILEYRNRIDELLMQPGEETDWEEVMAEHLVQVSFFQHERLIHLIVTVTFAILEIISMAMLLMNFSWGVLGLVFLVMVLLVPYIAHYYLLENETQKMYVQYDRILQNIRTQNKIKTMSTDKLQEQGR